MPARFSMPRRKVERLDPKVAYRGFGDACERLGRLNDALQERHRDLAVSVRKLAREVARRKNAQKLLQESELKFRSVVESAQDAIVTVDSTGRLVVVNKGTELLFGFSRSQLIGRNVTRLIARPLRAAALYTLKCLAEGGERQHLKKYVKTFTERTGIKTDIEGSVSLEQLNNHQGTVLYRVAQESLTNVYRHAQATRVKIRLRQLPQAVCMEIADNGRAISSTKPANGAELQPLGLLGMQERVRLVNGQFAVESVPKRGTTVRVEIPVSHEPLAPAAPRETITLASN